MAETVTMARTEYFNLKKKAEMLDVILVEIKEADLDGLKRELVAWEQLSDEALENFEKIL